MLTRTTLTHLLLPAPTCPATESSQCGLDAQSDGTSTDPQLQRGPTLSSTSGDIALAGRARVRQQVHALKAIASRKKKLRATKHLKLDASIHGIFDWLNRQVDEDGSPFGGVKIGSKHHRASETQIKLVLRERPTREPSRESIICVRSWVAAHLTVGDVVLLPPGHALHDSDWSVSGYNDSEPNADLRSGRTELWYGDGEISKRSVTEAKQEIARLQRELEKSRTTCELLQKELLKHTAHTCKLKHSFAKTESKPQKVNVTPAFARFLQMGKAEMSKASLQSILLMHTHCLWHRT